MIELPRLLLLSAAFAVTLPACSSASEPSALADALPRGDASAASPPSAVAEHDAGAPPPVAEAGAEGGDAPLCAVSLTGAVTSPGADCAQVTLVQDGTHASFKLATETFGASLVVEIDGVPAAGTTFRLADARTRGEGLVRSGRARWHIDDRGATGDGDFALTLDAVEPLAAADGGRVAFALHGSIHATFVPVSRTGSAGDVILEGTF